MFTNNIACLQSCVLTNNNKDQSEWRIQQINHSRQEFMAINNPSPSGSGGLWTINPCLLWFIYYISPKPISLRVVFLMNFYLSFVDLLVVINKQKTKSTVGADEKD